MKAVVNEIQVNGGVIVHSLEEAITEYHKNHDSFKLHFLITLPNGETKSITIRQEQSLTVAYGDFEGLPNFIEYSQDVVKQQ
jgi:DNA invertase Pin-like site-specific DNA recombinase